MPPTALKRPRRRADNERAGAAADRTGEDDIQPGPNKASTLDALAAVRRLSFAALGDGDEASIHRELARELIAMLGVDQVHVARLAQDQSMRRGNSSARGRTARR